MKLRKFMISFIAVLVSVGLCGLEVKEIEASNNAIFIDDFTIGLGAQKYEPNPYWFDVRYTQDNELGFADYEYATGHSASSDNNSIVTVNVVDGKIKLKGISAGVTTVRLYRHNYNTKVQIGTAKITVVNPSVELKGDDHFNYGLGLQDSSIVIRNRDLKATYEFKVDKKGLKIYDDYFATGEIKTQLDATKAGKYSVEVIETVNGVSKVLGKYEVNIHKTSINKEVELELNAGGGQGEVFLKYHDKNYDYYFESNVDLYSRNPQSFTGWVSGYEYSTGKRFPQEKYNIYISSGFVHARQLGTQEVKAYRIPKGIVGNSKLSEDQRVAAMEAAAKGPKGKLLGTTKVTVVPPKPRV